MFKKMFMIPRGLAAVAMMAGVFIGPMVDMVEALDHVSQCTATSSTASNTAQCNTDCLAYYVCLGCQADTTTTACAAPSVSQMCNCRTQVQAFFDTCTTSGSNAPTSTQCTAASLFSGANERFSTSTLPLTAAILVATVYMMAINLINM